MIKTGVVILSYIAIIGGIAMMSVPWALIIGGGIVLTLSVIGEFRAGPTA